MIPFHRALIGTAIIFCAVFASWSLVRFRDQGRPGMLILGIVFMAGALALGYYLRHLQRFLRSR